MKLVATWMDQGHNGRAVLRLIDFAEFVFGPILDRAGLVQDFQGLDRDFLPFKFHQIVAFTCHMKHRPGF